MSLSEESPKYIIDLFELEIVTIKIWLNEDRSTLSLFNGVV